MDKYKLREFFKLWQTEDNGHLPNNKLINKDSVDIPKCGTPWAVLEEYINLIPNQVLKDPNLTIGTDIPELVHILVKEKGLDPAKIDLDCDSIWKQEVAKTYGVVYNKDISITRSDINSENNDMKKKFTVNIINHKYTDIVDNSHIPGKQNTPVSMSKQRIINGLSYVEENGYFGTISTSQSLLSAGQKSVLPTLLKYKIEKVFAELEFPGNLGVEISGIFLQKKQSDSNIVLYRDINGKEFNLDLSNLVYVNNGKKYIPAGVTKESVSLFDKILKINNDIFVFSHSSSKGKNNLVGFWGGRNVALSPKHFKLTFTGSFGKNEKESYHNCDLGNVYPEENIRAVFQGKWFHWFLTQIIRKPYGNKPVGVSYFPQIDLSKKWTFDKFAKLINATEEQKQIVLDWASKKNEDWQD